MAYRKLRSSRNGFGSSSRIYLGKDHLLTVESNIFTEKYYRFYFSDIQAFIVKRTDRGTIWSVALGFIALLMTTCSISSIPPDKWAPTPGYFILALTAVTFIIVNLKKGPSCTTHIQTRVTVQKIGALHRIERTEEVLRELRSHVRRNQGSLSRDQVLRDTIMPEEEIHTGDYPAAEYRVQEHELVVRNPARFHRCAFVMILLNGGIDILWLFVHGLTVYIIGAVGGMAAFGGIIAALVVQTRKNTTAAVRKITWAMLVSYLALFAVSYAVTIYYTVQTGIQELSRKKGFDPFSLYTELVEKGPMDRPGFAVLTLVSIALSLVLGIGGLAAMGRKKHENSGIQNKGG